jgi:hypothetical protein
MTKRITVSLPDDVAAYLEGKENASAAVTEALRGQMNRAAVTEAMLRAAGFNITEEGKARWRGKFPPLTPEQREENRRLLEMIKTGTLPTDGSDT